MNRRAHQCEIAVVATGCREPRDLRLEGEPRLEPLANVVEPGIGNEEAAVDLEDDETVAREPAERLAHRAARDPETVRELPLCES